MTIEGFDYEGLANSMGEQAPNLLPKELEETVKKYIADKVKEFTLMTGEALYNDTTIEITAEEATFISQIIAEWTFHKSVDLAHSEIKQDYWDKILKKIAFVLFEVAKQGVLKKIEQAELLTSIEFNMGKTYKESLVELKNEGAITDEILQNALKQSHIDEMVEKYNKETEDQEEEDIDYSEFEVESTEEVTNYQEELTTYDENLELPEADIMKLSVGKGLLSIADPDQSSELVAGIVGSRQYLTNEYGFIIPNVRIKDSSELEEYEYAISVRGDIVGRGYVYPEKYMVLADLWDETGANIPEDAIVGVEPVYKVQAFWMSLESTNGHEDLPFVDAVDVIKKHIEACALQYVDEIMTDSDVEKYLEVVKKESVSRVEYLQKYLSVYDIRQILVNLVREKVSIRDIGYVFMKLCGFVKYSTNITSLSERVRASFGRAICLQNVNEDNVLHVLELSSELEESLLNSVKDTEYGDMLLLESEKISALIEKVAVALMNTYKEIGNQPILVVNPKIRSALYNLLIKHIPTIVVMSYAELVPEIIVESCGKIE